MRALVTGANGLIGSNVVRALLSAGHRVRAFTRAGSDRSSIEDLPIEWAVGDVLAVDDVVAAAAEVDVIFHTAVPFAYAGQADDDVDRVAVGGTDNVLAAAEANRARRVVITSSSVVFGYSTTPEARDESSLTADGAGEPGYVQAKLRQDRAALRMAQDRDLDVVVACPTMAVGPGGARLGPSNAMVVQYLADPLAMTYQGGVNVVAAEDVGIGHLQLALDGRSGERYLLGGDNLTWTRIHTVIAELTGRQAPRAVASPPATYLAAWAEEGLSRLQRRAPVATREQASMTGRYYWYTSDKAAGLGYRARPASQALAEAVSWLATTTHISREMRTTMTLSHEVYEARRAMAAKEDR